MKKSLNILGFITALLMFSTVVMKSNHLPGAGIVMVLSGVALSCYLPFLLLYTPGETNTRSTNFVAVIGAISASAINFGITLKFQHWPGAGIMLVVGLISFSLIFVPLMLRKKLQEEGSERKTLMNTLGATGLTLFALGILFKLMHWPGASIMLFTSVFFLFFGYFLMYLSDRSIDQETKTAYLRKAYLSVIIGCVVTSLILVALNKPYFAHPEEQQALVTAP